jgi:hypothetical protein
LRSFKCEQIKKYVVFVFFKKIGVTI